MVHDLNFQKKKKIDPSSKEENKTKQIFFKELKKVIVISHKKQ